jgi:hypothetical protein
VVTINKVRSERGLPPMPWGDVPWLPLGPDGCAAGSGGTHNGAQPEAEDETVATTKHISRGRS